MVKFKSKYKFEFLFFISFHLRQLNVDIIKIYILNKISPKSILEFYSKSKQKHGKNLTVGRIPKSTPTIF